MDRDWLIKNPMTRFYIIAGGHVFVMLFILITAFMASRNDCSGKNCRGSINIELVELQDSSPYRISVIFPDGKSRVVNCLAGGRNKEIPFKQICWPTGAEFYLKRGIAPPEEITVIVEVDGRTSTKVYRPVYEKEQPNGEDCPPVCYSATIQINISQ